MKTDLESRVLELRGTQYSPAEVMKLTGASSVQQVNDILEQDKEKVLRLFKDTPATSETYNEVLLHTVKYLRNNYHMNYREIAEAMGLSQYLVFDLIRRSPVSSGKHNNYVKGYFTREEKRMRNEDMIRMNKEGKTFAEIGRTFYVSKQNISQIFKEMKVKPISEKEALSVGVGYLEVSPEDIELKDKNKELKDKIINLQKQLAMTRYYMNGQIHELRIKYITAIAKQIEKGIADSADIKEYKVIHQSLMRTYNTMVKEDTTDTALFKQIEAIIPLLARTNVKLK